MINDRFINSCWFLGSQLPQRMHLQKAWTLLVAIFFVISNEFTEVIPNYCYLRIFSFFFQNDENLILKSIYLLTISIF